MIKKELKYSYNDVSIIPAKVSGVEHRIECNPFTSSGMLPLFTAPMSGVVGLQSYIKFEDHGIIPIIPRSVDYSIRLKKLIQGTWSAFSLWEAKNIIVRGESLGCNNNILIDIANGHMMDLYDTVKKLKSKYSNLTIMVGNIANPETYAICEESGVDFVRVGIGSGRGCITSSNVSIHYPMASLIEDTRIIKDKIGGKCRIVADGGVRNYSDIIKALALGADYVMAGSIFNEMLESEAPVLDENYIKLSNLEDIKYAGEGKFTIRDLPHTLYKKFYGMASGQGQIDIGGKKTKTSEGIEMYLPIKYTIRSWTNNFKDYLRSAMSYTGTRSLSEFIGKVDLVVISENTYQSINK
jgi:IMP dehydrogenase/GMP reductase